MSGSPEPTSRKPQRLGTVFGRSTEGHELDFMLGKTMCDFGGYPSWAALKGSQKPTFWLICIFFGIVLADMRHCLPQLRPAGMGWTLLHAWV